MPQQILSDYLAEIARIRATRAGTGEISYYGALTGALNAAGERLKPRVFCVPNLRNRGSGFPDMGLFVAARGMPLEEWPEARAPERGVVEVDDIPADLLVKSDSAQVRRYLAAYGLVLVTNYRDFVLLGRDARGRPERRESFSFDCADAAAFFTLARGTRRPPGLAARFAEFLERVLLHQARSPGRKMLRSFLLRTRAMRWLGWKRRRACLPSPNCGVPCRKPWGCGSKDRKASTCFAAPWCKHCSTDCSAPGWRSHRTARRISIGARPAGPCTCRLSIRCFSASPRRNT